MDTISKLVMGGVGLCCLASQVCAASLSNQAKKSTDPMTNAQVSNPVPKKSDFKRAVVSDLELGHLSVINSNLKAIISDFRIAKLLASRTQNIADMSVAEIILQVQDNDLWQKGLPLLGTLQADDGRLSYKFKRQNHAFWLGSSRLHFDELAIKNFKMKKQALLEDVKVLTRSNQLAGRSNLFVSMTADKIENEIRTVGPFAFNASLTGLDSQAITVLKNRAKMYQASRKKIDPTQDPAAKKALLRLLSSGFKLAASVNFKDPDGQLLASGTLTLAKGSKDYPNFVFAMMAANAVVHAKAPRLMVHNMLRNFLLENDPSINKDKKKADQLATARIDGFMKKHLLIQKGASLRFVLTYKNGSLLINGQAPQVGSAAHNSHGQAVNRN